MRSSKVLLSQTMLWITYQFVFIAVFNDIFLYTIDSMILQIFEIRLIGL